MRRYRRFSDLVALFANTEVFECRSAPSSALRSLRRTAGGTPQSHALRRSRYDPLDTSPYLRTEPLEIFQCVFSQNKGARQACLAPIACDASTNSHDDHSCNIRVKRRVASTFPTHGPIGHITCSPCPATKYILSRHLREFRYGGKTGPDQSA